MNINNDTNIDKTKRFKKMRKRSEKLKKSLFLKHKNREPAHVPMEFIHFMQTIQTDRSNQSIYYID